MLLDECPAELELFAFGPVLNCYHPPVSLVGRFRLGGQVLHGIVNIKPKEIANALNLLHP